MAIGLLCRGTGITWDDDMTFEEYCRLVAAEQEAIETIMAYLRGIYEV